MTQCVKQLLCGNLTLRRSFDFQMTQNGDGVQRTIFTGDCDGRFHLFNQMFFSNGEMRFDCFDFKK